MSGRITGSTGDPLIPIVERSVIEPVLRKYFDLAGHRDNGIDTEGRSTNCFRQRRVFGDNKEFRHAVKWRRKRKGVLTRLISSTYFDKCVEFRRDKKVRLN